MAAVMSTMRSRRSMRAPSILHSALLCSLRILSSISSRIFATLTDNFCTSFSALHWQRCLFIRWLFTNGSFSKLSSSARDTSFAVFLAKSLKPNLMLNSEPMPFSVVEMRWPLRKSLSCLSSKDCLPRNFCWSFR